MGEYVEIADGLDDVSSLTELDRILAEMAVVQAQINALLEEQARQNELN
jgi:hypothetical protein